jgi:hypothetical protein
MRESSVFRGRELKYRPNGFNYELYAVAGNFSD